jgi:hypothetical protein
MTKFRWTRIGRGFPHKFLLTRTRRAIRLRVVGCSALTGLAVSAGAGRPAALLCDVSTSKFVERSSSCRVVFQAITTSSWRKRGPNTSPTTGRSSTASKSSDAADRGSQATPCRFTIASFITAAASLKVHGDTLIEKPIEGALGSPPEGLPPPRAPGRPAVGSATARRRPGR